jgi:N-acetylglucosamine malate deacetylase 2
MTTMVIVAHPDDETLHCGAYIVHAARSGEDVVTLNLTRGENGRTLGLCDSSQLGAVRVAELRAAANVLGVKHVLVHELPDGLLAEHAAEATRLVRAELSRWHPDTVVAFAPNGINGHPDHVAAHRIVLSALDGPERPRVLLMTHPGGYAEPARPGFLTPDQIDQLRLEPTMTVRAGDALPIKLRAMGCHETQALSVSKRLRCYHEHVLTEWFHELCSAVTTP